MSGVGDARTFALLDKDIETAAVFRLFLALAKDYSLPTSAMTSWTIRALVLFLQKWDCTALLKVTMLQLRDFIGGPDFVKLGGQASVAFWAAAQADDPVTCTLVLKTCYSFEWKPVADQSLANCDALLPGASCWNPLGWNLTLQRSLPELYAWALGRAFHAVGATKALAPTFKEYHSKARTKDVTG